MSKLEIIVAHKAWRKIPGLEAKLRKAAKTAHDLLPKKFHFPCTATLLLTDDETVQNLNRRFRARTSQQTFCLFRNMSLLNCPKLVKKMAGGSLAIS